jgi:hypothetical protein
MSFASILGRRRGFGSRESEPAGRRDDADDPSECLPPNSAQPPGLEPRNDRLGDADVDRKLALGHAQLESRRPNRRADRDLAQSHEGIAVVAGRPICHRRIVLAPAYLPLRRPDRHQLAPRLMQVTVIAPTGGFRARREYTPREPHQARRCLALPLRPRYRGAGTGRSRRPRPPPRTGRHRCSGQRTGGGPPSRRPTASRSPGST